MSNTNVIPFPRRAEPRLVSGNLGYFLPSVLVKESANSVRVFNGVGEIGAYMLSPKISFERLAKLLGSPIQEMDGYEIIGPFSDADSLPAAFCKLQILIECGDADCAPPPMDWLRTADQILQKEDNRG